ncbi:hypothetical protein RAE19_19120 [Rhodoferax sp. TBRC 17660]|uniref:Uncharacterized protein n=1 Tax=Rhodoferax potami TaxID=3068338 RepID=A0ABU3KU47_9BURK|nr:hypothetical protein [Rhodoferax sp. TBRC 17660]MDT7520754.1 hypothetical protein [Rhodoferax sp. TBRC 17660]
MSTTLNPVLVSLPQVPEPNQDVSAGDAFITRSPNRSNENVEVCESINDSIRFVIRQRNYLQARHIGNNKELKDSSIDADRVDIKVHKQSIVENGKSDSLLKNNNQISNEFASSVCGSTQLPFTQRHPFLSALFGAIVTIFATPFIALGNMIITPFLMGAAFISQACGKGEIAKRIGGWGLTKVLMGVNASLLAKGELSTFELAAMAIMVPYTVVVGIMASGYNLYESSQEFLNKQNHDAKLDNQATNPPRFNTERNSAPEDLNVID